MDCEDQASSVSCGCFSLLWACPAYLGPGRVSRGEFGRDLCGDVNFVDFSTALPGVSASFRQVTPSGGGRETSFTLGHLGCVASRSEIVSSWALP